MIGEFRQAIGIAMFALAAIGSPGDVAAQGQRVELTLLHVNDVYEISPKEGKGGLAELMTLLRAERARSPNTITTFGGDLLSPSVMSGLFKGEQMIDVINAVGIDVAVPGNHEFDFGPDVFAKRVAESKFTWLGTNVLGTDGQPFAGMAASEIREVGGFKIGLFGVLTGETTHLSSPGDSVTFTDVEAAANQAVVSLDEQGADLIIALTHLDIAQDRALARKVEGIDVILGGHDHDPIAFYEGDKLILKAGYDAHYLAVADLVIEKKEKRGKLTVSMLPQFRFVSTAGVTPDSTVAEVVAKYESQLDEELSVAVGTTSVELDSRRSAVRTRETNMGNLIADAMRAAVDADVAIANGGGIRGDRVYDPGATLTRKDVLTELPFGNVTVLMEISGADLRAALENAVSRVEDIAGRFPQVSGMTVAYDPAKRAGERIIEVKVAGAAVDDERTYKLATNDYIAGGGDGYEALTRGKLLIDSSGARLMASQVMSYIRSAGTIAPKVEGRIQAR